jgi:MEMO1 family protein
MIRQPAVSGTFYPSRENELMREISSLIDSKARKEKVIAALVPHAGYIYSGRVAGQAYSRMIMPETIVFLGPNHHGVGPDFSIMTRGIWMTPVGDLNVDSILASEIYKNSKNLTEDDFSQSREHSIEVQLPFIKYLSPTTEIVPISMKHYYPDSEFLNICSEIGKCIGESISRLGYNATVVASTDFTHYESLEKAGKNDRAAIEAIIELDSEKLFSEVKEKKISMCGYACAAAMIEASKAMNAKKARLIDYKTSKDVTGDKSSVVGYASITVGN